MQPKGDHELFFHLAHAAGQSPRPTVFNFPWGVFRCTDLSQVKAQYEEIFIRKEYKFTTNTPEPVIVDCGGNVGLSAIWFKFQYPKSKLTVYEPEPRLADCIEANLAAAQISGVTIHRKAAWVKDELIGFDHTGDDKGKIIEKSSRQVEAVDLATHLPDSIDLLKMDIEGAEYRVLNHLCETGAVNRIKNMVCEFHIFRGQENDFLNTLHCLKQSGFQLSMNEAVVGPWIGQAKDASPFEVIGRHHVMLEVYGWRTA